MLLAEAYNLSPCILVPAVVAVKKPETLRECIIGGLSYNVVLYHIYKTTKTQVSNHLPWISITQKENLLPW